MADLPPMVQIQPSHATSRGVGQQQQLANQLKPGQILEGIVQSNNPKGETQLLTKQGNLTIKAEPALQRYMLHGAKIRLRVEQRVEGTSAKILTIDDIPIDQLKSRKQLPDPSVIIQRSPKAPQPQTTYGNLRPTLPAGAAYPTGNTAPSPQSGTQAPAPSPPQGASTSASASTSSAASSSVNNTPPSFAVTLFRMPLLSMSTRQDTSMQQYLQQFTPAGSAPAATTPPTTGQNVALRLMIPPQWAAFLQPASPQTPIPGLPTASPTANRAQAATQAGNLASTQLATPSPQATVPQQTTPAKLPPQFIYGTVRHVELPTAPTAPQVNSLSLTPQPAPSSLSILQTPIGTFQLPLAFKALPEGTPLAFEMLPQSPQATSQPAHSFSAAELATRPLHWHAMEEALHYLGQLDGQQAQMLQQNLPNVSPRMLPTILFFLTALQGGGLSNWVGDTALQLLDQTGHPNLVQRLQQEFGAMQQLWQDTRSDQWQTTFLPFWNGERVEQLRFYRRPPEEGAEQAGFESHRFIVELHLSQLGPMQLDGFYKRWKITQESTQPTSQFSLTFRSLQPIADEVQSGIGEHFYHIIEASGMSGEIRFKQVAQFPTDGEAPKINQTLQQVIFD